MSADLRALAVEAYNAAYDVVESGEHARAIELAAAALFLWRRVPTCTEKNLAIGSWLYARALSKAGVGDVAVAVAEQALNHMKRIQDPSPPPLWLIASMHEGWARALVAAGDEQRASVALEEASQAIEAITDEKNKAIISEQFADLRVHMTNTTKPRKECGDNSSSSKNNNTSSSTNSLSNISSLLLIANHHLKTNSLDKAEHVLRQGISQFPSDFRVHFNLASCLCRQRGQDDQQQEQRAEEAIHCFERVVALDPSVLEAYGCLSGLYIKMKEATKALEWCKRGLEIDEKDSTCLFNANVALRLLDRLHDAVALTLRAIDASSSSTSLFSPLVSSSMPNIVLLKLLKQQEMQQEKEKRGAEQQSKNKRQEVGEEKDIVTIVCVKWGKKYSAHYVNVLYASLLRHWNSSSSSSSVKSPPLRLVCLTDDASGIDERVECKPFHAATKEAKWQGWWLKANLFCPSLALIGHIVYLDLDTVLCGPIDFLWSTPLLSTSAHGSAAAVAAAVDNVDADAATATVAASVRDVVDSAPFAPRIAILAAASLATEGRTCGVNSSLMVWHSSSTTLLAPLFSFLLSHYTHVTKCICKFDHYLEMMFSRMPSTATADGSAFPLTSFLESSSPLLPLPSPPSSSSSSCSSLLPPFFDERVQEEDVLVLLQHEKRIQDYCTFASTSSSSSLGGSSEHTSILCFPLLPKPHQVVEDASCFVSQHWQLA